ncbi:hypothetical protein [Actinomadura macra]|uniref:hypothetical protein n=1 Tax=Actinomadura macra TaxID=46164 RepID=UPI000829EB8C|nr:hypothetical protein [Actinomadura macra]
MTQQHPDPIAEGFQHTGQRLIQLVSAAAGVQQLVAQRKHRLKAARQALNEQDQRADEEKRRATRAHARTRWGRAHDRNWLRYASLLDVADAWAAGIPYAKDNSSAARAVDRCEEQLRHLHPHAMSHYDRFRSEGKDALDAMIQAAPFFAREPHVRTGHPAPPQAELLEGTGNEWAARLHGPDRSEWEESRRQQRASEIADQLRGKLCLQGHQPQPEELRTILEITTNLPEHVITKAVPIAPYSHLTPSPDVRGAAEDFPIPIDEALEMSANQPRETTADRRTPSQILDRNRRRSL